MKPETSPRRLDILGNGGNSEQRIFSSVLKRWQQRFSYWSIFAAVPAVLVSQMDVTRNVEAKPEAKVTDRDRTLPRNPNLGWSSRSLLKRLSEFRLPHQNVNDGLLAPLGGLDDCPGRAIPPGSYTAAAPFVDSGNTTGANNTINTLYIYCAYSSYDAFGPDHVYSFTLSAVGANPQIQISTSSSTYRPIAYVLPDAIYLPDLKPCPAGTGNQDVFLWCGRGDPTRPLDISGLPLNTPLYLVIDSVANDAGPYTIRMQDVTIAPPPSSNQIDDTQFFVQQHYRDFLNREADPEGLAFWMNEITSCGGDQQCIEVKRINDSGSFFLSIEFQETGYLVYRLYKAAYDDIPDSPVPIRLNEFLPDTQAIGRNVIVLQPGWEQLLENNKRAFLLEFVQRSRFTSAFPPAMSAAEFVDKLNANAGNPLSQTERDQLVSDLSSGAKSRAEVLRAVAENPKLVQIEFNRAFVLMQYFGYLRRNPNDAPDGNFAGYNFWLDKLNSFKGDFIAAEMVKAFLSSIEYRQRFGA